MTNIIYLVRDRILWSVFLQWGIIATTVLTPMFSRFLYPMSSIFFGGGVNIDAGKVFWTDYLRIATFMIAS